MIPVDIPCRPRRLARYSTILEGHESGYPRLGLRARRPDGALLLTRDPEAFCTIGGLGSQDRGRFGGISRPLTHHT